MEFTNWPQRPGKLFGAADHQDEVHGEQAQFVTTVFDRLAAMEIELPCFAFTAGHENSLNKSGLVWPTIRISQSRKNCQRRFNISSLVIASMAGMWTAALALPLSLGS
jgi:hypothetical protein